MALRSALLSLFLVSPPLWAEHERARETAGQPAATPMTGAELQQLWQSLLRGVGVNSASPASAAVPSDRSALAQTLAQREAELASIAEQNQRQAEELAELAEIVQLREAELARRSAEQAELADRLARLEALLDRSDP